jgi:methionyl-tRNA formyltransferase
MNHTARVLFIGSKSLGLKCLKKMVELDRQSIAGILTLDDSGDVRNAHQAFLDYGKESGLPLYVARNRADSERIILECAPDICIVVGWYWLIGKQVLDKVPRGLMGIHLSLLPAYRGGAPLVWSIINGEKEVGFSMFSFTEGMDDGDIWFAKGIPVKPEDTVKTLLEEIESTAVAELATHYGSILDGTLKPVPQRHEDATYCAMRSPEDGLIDWTRPASYVHNFIRAQTNPYPGAFSFLDGRKVTVLDAVPQDMTYYGTPGQVARITTDGVTVIAGDDRTILIRQVECDGKQMPAGELIRSVKARLRNA